MEIFSTERLILREFTDADAAFVLRLLNEPSWLRFIGDRGVRTLADAEAYLTKGPRASYAQHGFGLWWVGRKADGVPLGMCGLLKRDTLQDVDVGYAFLPEFCGQGYAREAVAATLAHGRRAFGLKRIVAVTAPDNEPSIRLLGKLGFRFERMITFAPDKPESKLFASEA
jgi:RimJ/RimL family protein N-acetyltransferase